MTHTTPGYILFAAFMQWSQCCPDGEGLDTITEWLPGDFLDSITHRQPDVIRGTLQGATALICRLEPFAYNATTTAHKKVFIQFTTDRFNAGLLFEWTPDDEERSYVNFDSDCLNKVEGDISAFMEWVMTAKLAGHPMFAHVDADMFKAAGIHLALQAGAHGYSQH